MPSKPYPNIIYKCRSSKSLHQILEDRRHHGRESQVSVQRDVQKAALKLLDHHQDVEKLLQEIQTKNDKCRLKRKIYDDSSDKEDGTEKKPGCESNIEETTITSCLRHQAALTGVPISWLAAKKWASVLCEDIIKRNQDATSPLLTASQMDGLDQMLHLIQSLKAEHLFHRGQFVEAIIGQAKSKSLMFPLELLWCLHKESLVTFDTFLCHAHHQSTHSNIASDVANLWIDHSYKVHAEDDNPKPRQIFLDFVSFLVQAAYPRKEASSETTHSLSHKIAQEMLDITMTRLFEAASDTSFEFVSHERVLPMEEMQAASSREAAQQFAAHHLAQLLCLNPIISVTEAISKQTVWSFSKAAPFVVSIFRQLLTALQETDAVGLLRNVLDHEEINWQSTLIYTSTVLVYFPAAKELINKCISDFVEQAFQSYEEDSLLSAILLVRQAAHEGPHIFPSYAAWFKETFSSSGNSPCTNRKTFTFLMEFLTKLVPHETAAALKAHIQNPPSSPPKCQNVLQDYLLLAKTRLSDLNESWQTGEFPGAKPQITGARSARPQDQACHDVEIAVESFEKNNRIPTNVLEASIFRRPYYMTHFLPALLKPRMLPDIADGKMKLIESLKNANKIPLAVYEQYEAACAKELNELLDGAFSEDVMEGCLEPLDALKAGLEKLRNLVGSCKDKQPDHSIDRGELTAQLALLSDKVSAALGLDAPPSQPTSYETETTCIDLQAKLNNPVYKQVADVILESFASICCEMEVIKKSPGGVGKATIQMVWAQQFLAMLSRFSELCAALYQSVWAALCQQNPCTDDVLTGISCFLFYAHTLSNQYPSVVLHKDSSSKLMKGTLLEAVCSELQMCTSQQMCFAARFLSALLLHFQCYTHAEHGGNSEDTGASRPLPRTAVEKFCYLVPRLCPDVRELSSIQDERTDEEGDAMEIGCPDDALMEVGKQFYSTASLMSRLPTTQLAFATWIEYELDVELHQDYLTDLERHDFQKWALLCHFLPLPTSRGGCSGCCRRAFAALFDGLMDHGTWTGSSQRESEAGRDNGSKSNDHHHHHHRYHSCWRELLQCLQELIPLFDGSHVNKPVSGDHTTSPDTWLLPILHTRLAKRRECEGSSTSALGDACSSHEAVETETFVRILCCLPPYLIFTPSITEVPNEESLEAVSQFVNVHLRKQCMETWCSLPYLITTHLVQGLLTISQKVEESAIHAFLTSCPLLMASTLMHWRRILPFVNQGCGYQPDLGVFQKFQDLCAAAEVTARNASLSHSSSSPTSAPSTTSRDVSSAQRLGAECLAMDTSSAREGVPSVFGAAMVTLPWVCAIATFVAVRRMCRPEERNGTLSVILQMLQRHSPDDSGKVRAHMLECLLLEEAWDTVIGRSIQQKPSTCEIITLNVATLIECKKDPSMLQDSVSAQAAVHLVPVVIFRNLLTARNQMQSLLSQHPSLMDFLLCTHNALVDVYCQAGGPPPVPSRGIRKAVRADKGDVLSADLMLSISRLLHFCISVCPPAHVRMVGQETLSQCNEELKAAIRRHAPGKGSQ